MNVPALRRAQADRKLLGAETEAFELLVEARHAATAIEQLLGATGPSGMRVRINVELHLSPGLPQVERVVNSLPSVMTTVMVW